MHILNNKTMNTNLVKDRLVYLKRKADNKAKINQLLKQEPTQERDALIWLLEGKPLSMATAFSEMGIGSYRDIIYFLRKNGNDIKDFWLTKKGYRGRVVRWKIHYLACYPESVIRFKSQN